MCKNHALPNAADFALQKAVLSQLRKCLPIYFCVNGHTADLSRLTRTDNRSRPDVLQSTYIGAVDGITVILTLDVHHDYPVLVWHCTLRNDTAAESGRLTCVRGMDVTLPGSNARLHHWTGDVTLMDSCIPLKTALSDKPLLLAPKTGRPCEYAFPYFRILSDSGVISAALGWSGQWEAQFAADDGGVSMLGYQQRLDTTLHPGEELLLPSGTLLLSASDEAHAINLWRRYYLDHVLPRPEGKPLAPILSMANMELGIEHTKSTEQQHIDSMDYFASKDMKPDFWWLDAGWYPLGYEDGILHWHFTGTWKPDPERYPNGLKPVSDALKEKFGAKFLLWFDPERVYRGTELWNEHPEWLLFREEASLPEMPQDITPWLEHPQWLSATPETVRDTMPDLHSPPIWYLQHAWLNALFDLSNDEARNWLVDTITAIIQEADVRCYREDFNIMPLHYWLQHEQPGRAGMMENAWIRGFYRFWDDLLERNPGIFIDTCASGGHRNDIEALRRSVPLHYTDLGYGIPGAKTGFQQTMYQWMPYFKEFPMAWDTPEGIRPIRYARGMDTFAWKCALAPFLWLPYDRESFTDDEWAQARQQTAIWRENAQYLYGDFYELAPFGNTPDRWVAWQFDKPETGDGLLVLIRHADCMEESFTARLHNLDERAVYTLTDPESGETFTASGKTLADGLAVTLPKRAGKFLRYQKA